MIYVATNGLAIKVGWSQQPRERMKQLQGSSHLEITLCRVIECFNYADGQVESALHALLSDHHIRGEWFKPSALAVLDEMTDDQIRELGAERDPESASQSGYVTLHLPLETVRQVDCFGRTHTPDGLSRTHACQLLLAKGIETWHGELPAPYIDIEKDADQ